MLILCATLCAVAGAKAGSNPTISGRVRDAVSGEPLFSAAVQLEGTSFGMATDEEGKYAIRDVPPGSYTIRFAYVGYKTLELPTEVKAGADVTLDVKLDPVAIEGQEVIVTAQAKGQKEAINEQLASDRIVNVVSAARIQELPDANAAEAVGRLPGIFVLRNGGEGTEVVVRGLQPKYNAIMVDGVRMTSSGESDRSSDLSMISPYMLEGIEVSKTVTADQDGDVLGGTVNFKLREAGAGREGAAGLGFSVLAEGGYTGLSDASLPYNNYKYVGSVEGRLFDDQSLGIFAQADLERRNLSSNEYGGSFDHPGDYVNFITKGLNLNDISRDRQRTNGTLLLDYRIPDGKITFMNFGSGGTTNIQNRGEFLDVADNLHQYSLAYSRSTTNILTNALTVDQQLDPLHINAKFSHAYTETKNPGDWTVGFQQASAGFNQYTNVINLNPRYVAQAANDDTNATYLGSLVSSSSFSRERAFAGSLDLETNVNLWDVANATLKAGGKYRYQTRSYIYDQFSGQGLGLASARYVDNLIATHFPSTAPYAGTTSIPITPFVDPHFSYGKFLNGDFPMVLPLDFPMVADMANYVRNSADLIAQNDAIAYFHSDYSSTTNNYSGHENQGAGYVMATLALGSDITIIPGIRYQDLRTSYTAPRGYQTTASATGGAYSHYDTTITVDHPYWLPDVSLRYKPLSWFDVRLSYSNTLAYPDYIAIVPRIDVSTGNAISWNNTNLVPSRSRNYDVYLSFYENSIGLFTVGGFFKQIDNLIYQWTFNVSDTAALAYLPPGPVSSPPNGVYSIATYVNDPYKVNDWGLEADWQTHFWYLPHPFDGLVLNINYTHTYSKAQYPYTNTERNGRQLIYVDTSFTDRLLDQPNDIVNFSVGYDFEGFSIRASMLYQADIFTGPNYWPQLRTTTSSYRRWGTKRFPRRTSSIARSREASRLP